jgi:predicted AlkP superfamily phosphohydrolase/phosphomutase
LEQLGPDDCLFVVSDHGFQAAARLFDINEYLYSKGLLRLNATTQHNRTGRSASLKYALKQAGLLSAARKVKSVLKRAGALKEVIADMYQPLLTDIDWEHTQAYVPSLSGFLGGYADIFLEQDLDAERITELVEDLKRQIDPATRKPLIDAIYTTEAYGKGPYAPPEPHLLLLPTEGITFRMDLGNKRLWDDPSYVRGAHHKDGVLYAYGGDIKHGFKAPNAEVYDIVPTVLHSMGLPLPGPFDGHVLDEVFVERNQSEQTPASNSTEDGGARRRLRKLLEA